MAIEFSETQDLDAVLRAIGRRVLKLARSGEMLEFAKKGTKSTTVKQCKTGYSCGYSCVSKTKNCKSPLPNQGKTYADWLANQIMAGIALQPHHQSDAQAMGLTGQTPTATPAATPKKPRVKKSTQVQSAQIPIQAQTVQSPIKVNQPELDSRRNDLVKRFGQQAVENAENNVKRILDDADVFVRVGSSDTLEKILGDRFRTSAELGVTTHTIPDLKDKNYQDARNRVEAKTMGYDPKTTKPEDRVIYGYFGNGKDLTGQSHADPEKAYGTIAVKLKPDVKDRLTFTGADSFKSGIASQIQNDGAPPPPSAASLIPATRHGYDRENLPNHYPGFFSSNSPDGGMVREAAKAKSIDELAPKLALTGNAYVEAQIHGKVMPSDIAEIHFSPKGVNDRPSAAIAQFAKDNSVDLYVKGKKLSQSELDNIIAPPKKHKVQELNEALDRGDFSEVLKRVDELDSHAQGLKLDSGERDSHLKALYELSGYDGKPRVGTEQDVTDTWQAGGALMVRGVQADSRDKLKYLKQFQNGNYFVGNGIYGNGTYVGHAGTIKAGSFVGYNASTANNDAKRAFKQVAKHGYIDSSTINFRMALDPSANIGIQSDVESERKRITRSLDTWRSAEEKNIQASAQKFSKSDIAKHKAALTQAKKDNAGLALAQPVKTKSRSMNGGMYEKIHYTVTHGNDSLSLEIHKEEDLLSFSSKKSYDYYFVNADGVRMSARNQKEAISKAHASQIDAKVAADALKISGLKSDPNKVDPITQKKLDDLYHQTNRVKAVLGLDDYSLDSSGNISSNDNGALGRFAVLRGYDAIALDQSYEPDTFMNLLNRSKVVIQKDPLNYTKAKKTGAA